MVERIKKLVIDDALKPGIDIGPCVDGKQLEKNLSMWRSPEEKAQSSSSAASA